MVVEHKENTYFSIEETVYTCEPWMLLKGALLTLGLNFMGFHTS